MTPPLTPMEDGGTWATLAEGDAFLETVASDSGNVTILDIGPCSDGSPMRVCVVAPGGVSDLSAARGALLVVASQHGQERAPREAALRFVRDLAYSPPGGPVVVIPTANPYGTEAVDRRNANGEDINRHHVDLTERENLLISDLVTHLDPCLIVDGHEKSAPSEDVSTKTYEFVVAPSIESWGDDFESQIAAGPLAGVTWSPYPKRDHEGTLVSAMTARGLPALLIETLGTEDPEDRVGWQLAIMAWCVEYVEDEAATLTQVKAEARAYHAAEGFAAHAPIYLYENGWAEAPVGYTNVEGVPPRTLAALGIRTEQRSPHTTDLYVPMDQPCAPLIPWLLDRRAPRPVVAGEPAFADRLAEQPVDLLRESDLHQTVIRAAFPVRRVVTEHGVAWGS